MAASNFASLPQLPTPGPNQSRSPVPSYKVPSESGHSDVDTIRRPRASHAASLKSPALLVRQPSTARRSAYSNGGEGLSRPVSRAATSDRRGSFIGVDGTRDDSLDDDLSSLGHVAPPESSSSRATEQRAAPPRRPLLAHAASKEPLLVQPTPPKRTPSQVPEKISFESSAPAAEMPFDDGAPRRDKNAPRPSPNAKRVYETYPANLLFLCGGRVMTSRPSTQIPLVFPRFGFFSPRSFRRRNKTSIGRFGQPELPSLEDDDDSDVKTLALPLQSLFSFLLSFILGVLFLASQSSYLSSALSPAVPAVFGYLWLISLVSMLRCAGSDPGIVPRGLDREPEKVWRSTAEEGGWSKRDVMEVGEWEIVPRWVRLRRPGGGGSEWVKCKWCPTCESYRPPRSSHCRLCDCCIDGIDHHCQYLNVCIGARNYRTFSVFIHTTFLSLLYVIACCIWRLVHTSLSATSDGSESTGFVGALRASPLALVLALLCFALAGPVGALCAYHIYLTVRGLTTIEYLRLSSAKKFAKRNPDEAAAAEAADKRPPNDVLATHRAAGDSNIPASSSRYVKGGRVWRGWVERICRPEIETWVQWREWEEDRSDSGRREKLYTS